MYAIGASVFFNVTDPPKLMEDFEEILILIMPGKMFIVSCMCLVPFTAILTTARQTDFNKNKHIDDKNKEVFESE